MSDHSVSKEILPNIQSKPPLTQLEAIASHPIASCLPVQQQITAREMQLQQVNHISLTEICREYSQLDTT